MFHITPLMWTNAANALGYLGLNQKVKDKFCWDMLNDNYEEAVEVPIKAGIVLMLLLSRIDKIPYRYEREKQSSLMSDLYSVEEYSPILKESFDWIARNDEYLFNVNVGCLSCIPGYSDIIILVDVSSNLPASHSPVFFKWYFCAISFWNLFCPPPTPVFSGCYKYKSLVIS